MESRNVMYRKPARHRNPNGSPSSPLSSVWSCHSVEAFTDILRVLSAANADDLDHVDYQGDSVALVRIGGEPLFVKRVLAVAAADGRLQTMDAILEYRSLCTLTTVRGFDCSSPKTRREPVQPAPVQPCRSPGAHSCCLMRGGDSPRQDNVQRLLWLSTQFP